MAEVLKLLEEGDNMLVFLIVILALIVVLVLVYFIEPFIYALIFSWIISIFVRNPPFIPVEEYFPESKLLRDNYATIRAELDEILKSVESIPKFNEVDKMQGVIAAKDNIAWRTFFIKGFDMWSEANCAMVPKTTALLKQLPQITTAMFSIIDGKKHIPPHYGFFKSVLRYHLGLIIPKGEVYITVGGQKYSWAEGQDVLFDDTYLHEVWNKTDGRRVVLFCDVLRDKGLPTFFKKINASMFRMLQKSKKLRESARKAEVAKPVSA